MRVKERRRRKDLYTKRIETNEEVRARFEKEAHDREREEILQVSRGYEEWISENTIRQLSALPFTDSCLHETALYHIKNHDSI